MKKINNFWRVKMTFEILSITADIILTIVTAIMAIETYKMAKSTSKSVEEMKLTRKETNSAEVIMYFEIDSSRMYLVIENVGSTIAKDVKIDYEPLLKNSRGQTFDYLKNISYLPPNYKIKTFFDMTRDYYNKYKDYPQTKFDIEYINVYGDKVSRNYQTDQNYLKNHNFLFSESETVEMSLYKIRKDFDKISSYLKEINKKTGK